MPDNIETNNSKPSLTPEELKELQDSFDTARHAIGGAMGEVEDALCEVEYSRKLVEGRKGRACSKFAEALTNAEKLLDRYDNIHDELYVALETVERGFAHFKYDLAEEEAGANPAAQVTAESTPLSVDPGQLARATPVEIAKS